MTSLLYRLWTDLFCLLSLARMRTGFPSLFTYILAWELTATPMPFSQSLTEHPVLFGVGLLISYMLGVVVNLGNTVSDLAEDRINLPHRVRIARLFGLRRLLKVNRVLSWAMVGLAVCTRNVGLIVVVAAASWFMNQYNFPPLRLKSRPFLSLAGFAGGVYGPLLFAYLLNRPDLSWPGETFAWLFALITVWFGLFGTAKNIQDYEGDKAAGILTTATMFKSKKAAVTFVFALITSTPLLFLIPVATEGVPPSLLYVPVWCLFIGPMMMLNYRFRNNPKTLKKLQSVFFMYPIFFVPSLLFLLYPTWLNFGTVTMIFLLLGSFELLGLDARSERSLQAVLRMKSKHKRSVAEMNGELFNKRG